MTFAAKNRTSISISAVAMLDSGDFPASWIEPALGKRSSPSRAIRKVNLQSKSKLIKIAENPVPGLQRTPKMFKMNSVALL